MYFERRPLVEALSELLAPLDAYGFTPTAISDSRHSITATRGSPYGTYQIQIDFREEILASWIMLHGLEGYGELPVRIYMNLLAEIAGRRDRWVTQDDVQRADTLERVRALVSRECDNFTDFGVQVLLGSGVHEAVDAVYELIRDVPGDPRFDWWAYRRQTRMGRT